MDTEPKSIGHYRLLRSQGQGGMGVIWRAQDERSGRLVALKTVKVPHAELFASIRREIHALAQLQHPGIVRILDEGLHEGFPWYAMELLEGLPLRAWKAPDSGDAGRSSSDASATAEAQDGWTQSLEPEPAAALSATLSVGLTLTEDLPGGEMPASLRSVLGLVRRLCFALSYLHGEGLVHRDLKPDNILVRPDGQPVMVDFGLVSRSSSDISREALEVAGHISGTVAYMAPEQGRGQRVDARADLYSLGCILYQLITGRPPFVGQMPVQVLYQHFEVSPQPPSRLVPGLSPQLDELVLRLLQKEPRERFGYADDVSAALSSLGIAAEPPAGAPAAKAYLYRPGFTGRQDLLAELRKHLSALHSGAGALVLLGGESGVGKTRLLVELSSLASGERITVLTGECPPPSIAGGGAPLGAFRKLLQTLADRCREHGEVETDLLLGSRGRVLEAYEPALAELPGMEKYGPPAELPPQEALLRVQHCLLGTLTALVKQHGKLVLLLDDLQWADELSLGALELLVRARTLEHLPLLVVGTYRSEECGAQLRKLAEGAGVSTLDLSRLGAPAVTQMVSDMLGLEVAPQKFSHFLLQQSEGNPFFVAEYLRAAVGQRLLYRDQAGRWQVAELGDEVATEQHYTALSLPRSLLDLLGMRLSRLGADAQQLVEALSVLGREADAGVAADVSGLRSSKIMKATLEAFARQVLEPAEGERLRFVHDKVREVAYARLEMDRRRELHLAAAQVLEEAPIERRQEQFGQLGQHWEYAGEPARARPYYLAAAHHAAQRFSHQDAERLYRAFLRLAEGPSAENVAAHNELGEKLLLQGRGDEALAQHQQAVEEAVRLDDRALQGESLRLLGDVHWSTRRPEQALPAYEQALALLRETSDRRAEGGVLNSLARLYAEQGRFGLAVPLFQQALEIHRQARDRRQEANTLSGLGNVAIRQGALQEALKLVQQALEIHRQLGDLHAEANGMTSLAALQAELGDLDEACRLNERAIELLRKVGAWLGLGGVLSNLASVLMGQRRPEQALGLLEQALGLTRETGNLRAEGIVLSNLGALHFERGRLGSAVQSFDEAIKVHRQMGNRPFEASLMRNLGEVLMAQGRMREARQLFERSLELHREIGNSEGYVLMSMASFVALETGDLAEAGRLAGQAEAQLEATGDWAGLCRAVCRSGHLALAAGRGAREVLERAQGLTAGLVGQPAAEAGKAIARLERAQEAFEVGRRLFRGECVEDLPEGLRRWLVEEGHMERAGLRSADA